MTQQNRILIVDDDITITTALRVKLARAGFAVCEAHNGSKAWELLQNEPFDFVIVDEQMPGMNGSELCQRIRQAPGLKELPILMITGKLFESDRQRLFEQFRLVDAIPKPFSPRNVVRLVAEQFTPVSAGISS